MVVGLVCQFKGESVVCGRGKYKKITRQTAYKSMGSLKVIELSTDYLDYIIPSSLPYFLPKKKKIYMK